MSTGDRPRPLFQVLATLGGLFVGVFAAVMVGGFVAGLMVGSATTKQKRALPLAPVMVAAHPLSPGDVVKPDDLAIRSIPARLITGAAVKPGDGSYSFFQIVKAPVSQGAPLRWAGLTKLAGLGAVESPAFTECLRATTAAEREPAERAAAEIRARLTRTRGP